MSQEEEGDIDHDYVDPAGDDGEDNTMNHRRPQPLNEITEEDPANEDLQSPMHPSRLALVAGN